MKPIQTISILGAGAIGSFLAGKLFDMDPACVAFVAGGERYARLKEHGIVVNNKPYTISVLSPDDPAPPPDLIVVALKHHQLQEALPDLKNRVGEHTLFISLMNGLDSEAAIGALYGQEKVLLAHVVGIDAVREGNRVVYSKPGKVVFGEADNKVLTERVQRIRNLWERAGIPYETPVDMIYSLWWKFMVNVGVNQISAILRAPYGLFHSSPDAQALMESAMREVITIAQAAKVNLDEQDLKNWYTVLLALSPNGKTSMLQDIEANRKTEVEIFAGKVVELGQTYDIPTPVNLMLLRIIRVLEQGVTIKE